MIADLLFVCLCFVVLGVGAWWVERPRRTSEDWGYRSEGRWR